MPICLLCLAIEFLARDVELLSAEACASDVVVSRCQLHLMLKVEPSIGTGNAPSALASSHCWHHAPFTLQAV